MHRSLNRRQMPCSTSKKEGGSLSLSPLHHHHRILPFADRSNQASFFLLSSLSYALSLS